MSKYLWLFFLTLILLAGLSGVLAKSETDKAGVIVRRQPAEVTYEDPSGKIEKQVIDEITNKGQADFFLVLKEQADLRPATRLATKQQKGSYVYNALRATADDFQKSLRETLDKASVSYQSYYIVNMVLVRGGTEELLTALASRSDVARVSANHTFQLERPIIHSQPDIPTAVEPNLSFINADDVWALGYTGAGMVVAGGSTGLDWDHPAILPHYRGWNGSSADHNYNWWDATLTYPSAPDDPNGHGTMNTGIMVGDDYAGNQIGVAPGAKAISCKDIDNAGTGQDAWILQCFEWDLAPWDLSQQNPRPDLAPDVVDITWASPGGTSTYRTAIDHLQAAGIAVVVGTGSGGATGCASVLGPGDYAEVLTIGSVGGDYSIGTLPGTLSVFSGRGPSTTDGSYFPDVMAPGESVRSSFPGGGYQSWSGTSYATSHVSGLIALMWSANPALVGRVEPTYNLIKQASVPLAGQAGPPGCGGDYTTGPNNDWGYGTIDALAAIQMAIPPTPTPSPTPTVTPKPGPSTLFLSFILRSYPTVLFQDDFSSALGWAVITDPKGSAGPQSGAYVMRHTGKNNYVFCLAPVSSLLTRRSETKMEVHRDSGSDMRYGIIFDWIDQNHFYLFLVNPGAQTYIIYKYDGGYQSLASGTTASIHPNEQTNLLIVRKYNTRIEALANGQLIATATGVQTDAHSRSGLVITSGTNVPAQGAFDNFKITGWPP